MYFYQWFYIVCIINQERKVGKCLIIKLYIIGIMMWNKYKKFGKILKINRLRGNKFNNYRSIN